MLKLAVIGKDVSKSLSPAMHTFILKKMGRECTYDKISLSEEELQARAEELFGAYDGLNVTIPHKRNILPFLKKCEGDANVFGAVNTVLTRTRTGYNTDGIGFLTMLESADISVKNKRVLVLGAGGAGRSCISSLMQAGAKVFAYERSQERLEEVSRALKGFTPLSDASISEFDIIINCTGVGMHDTEGKTPCVFNGQGKDILPLLSERCGTAVDLIYEPKESAFLKAAKDMGKRALNGEAMLFYQAYAADCIFLGLERDICVAKEFYKEFREKEI